MKYQSAIAALVGAASLSGVSPSLFTDPSKGDADAQARACTEGSVSAFGRYVGSWNFVDSQITPDGTWVEGQGGEWDFHCLGEGIAIIDLWRPKAGGFGSTMRMLDPEDGTWDIVFTGEGSQAMSHLSGMELPDGSIELHYRKPLHDPRRRITFSAPADNAFDWTLAISRDAGETWTDVYKMRATRR